MKVTEDNVHTVLRASGFVTNGQASALATVLIKLFADGNVVAAEAAAEAAATEYYDRDRG